MVPGQTSQVKNVYPSQSTVVNTEALNVGMKLTENAHFIHNLVWAELEFRDGRG